MKKRNLLLAALLLILVAPSFAAKVDTLLVRLNYSSSFSSEEGNLATGTSKVRWHCPQVYSQ